MHTQPEVYSPLVEQRHEGRFEVYEGAGGKTAWMRDAMAGLIVALVAIPLGLGFAIASGLAPEQGIIAGALAGLLGGLFGGSKYQVYGPTAAFIPLLSSIVSEYGVSFLVQASVIAGVLIILMGVFKLGDYFSRVPFSVTVGFTVGIAGSIMVGQLPDVLGGLSPVSGHMAEKIDLVCNLLTQPNVYAAFIAVFSYLVIHYCYKRSVFIPGPLIAIVLAMVISQDLLSPQAVPLVMDKFGAIEGGLFKLTLPEWRPGSTWMLVTPVLSIVFIASLESLLSARMADRLAGNPTRFNPNRELVGQGIVNAVVPLMNGFPCTGAFARTAANIKAGAVSPAASMFQGAFILILMYFFSRYIALIPMACISGLLIYVAFGMVKVRELREVWSHGGFHTFLMGYTAVVTFMVDLFVAVSSATALYYLAALINKRSAHRL